MSALRPTATPCSQPPPKRAKTVAALRVKGMRQGVCLQVLGYFRIDAEGFWLVLTARSRS
jgi:hypothetical protein